MAEPLTESLRRLILDNTNSPFELSMWQSCLDEINRLKLESLNRLSTINQRNKKIRELTEQLSVKSDE